MRPTDHPSPLAPTTVFPVIPGARARRRAVYNSTAFAVGACNAAAQTRDRARRASCSGEACGLTAIPGLQRSASRCIAPGMTLAVGVARVRARPGMTFAVEITSIASPRRPGPSLQEIDRLRPTSFVFQARLDRDARLQRRFAPPGVRPCPLRARQKFLMPTMLHIICR